MNSFILLIVLSSLIMTQARVKEFPLENISIEKPTLTNSSSYSFNSPCNFVLWFIAEGLPTYTPLPTNTQFLDLNADGLTDLICTYSYSIPGSEHMIAYTFLNTGCGLIPQDKFTPASYCDPVLQNDNYRHLHKLDNDELEPALIAKLKPHFTKKSWRLIESTFKAEFVTLKSFYLLTEKHFSAMNLGWGNIATLLSLQ